MRGTATLRSFLLIEEFKLNIYKKFSKYNSYVKHALVERQVVAAFVSCPNSEM